MTMPCDAREIAQIRSTFNIVELITPINYHEAKQEWVSSWSRFDNPQFIYNEDAIKDAIEKIHSLVSLEDLLEKAESYDFFRGSGNIAYRSLKRRYEELVNLGYYLETLIDHTKMPGDHPNNPLEKLYGPLEPKDVEFARLLTKNPVETAYDTSFGWDGSTEDLRAGRCKGFFNGHLRGLKGMFSADDVIRLKAMKFDANDIASYFQLVLDYMRGHAFYGGMMTTEEEKNPSYQIEVSPNYTAINVNAFTSSGKPTIGIPADRKVNGLKLIELVGHELNSHYRSAMSTRALFRSLLDPYDDKCPVIPLIPMMSHSLNETLSEGLAKVSDIRVSGKEGMPKPYQVLAIDFARQGHNFHETMEYIFEMLRGCDFNSTLVRDKLNKAWNYTYRIFRGMRDTSSRCGYAFPKDKVYLCGLTTVVRNFAKWGLEAHHFESFMNLLRYSTLTIEELEYLDSRQNGVDYIFGPDPYPYWRYGDSGFGLRYDSFFTSPDPVEFIARLLLNYS